jgi:hypothetical protein
MNMDAKAQAFWRSARLCTVSLVLLLAFGLTPLTLIRAESVSSTIDLVRKTARKRGLNAEAREAQMAGYYQDLLNRSGDVVAATPQAFDQWINGQNAADARRPVHEVVEKSTKVPPINTFTKDYLIYRPRPHLDLPDARFPGFRHITNSHGFADREYPLERRPQTRRMILLGDSVARGLGVPIGQTFDARLEAHLNQRHRRPGVDEFEIINMGVSGYRITQIVDLALEAAPKFQPDVYLVVLTELSVFRLWDLHLAQIFDEGVDVKYDFLRNVVRDAGLKRGEIASTSHAKLARFMTPTLKWSLNEIRRKAAERNGKVLVLLLPTLRETGDLDHIFRPVRPLLEQEGIPYVDLLDAFDGIDLATLDAGDGGHANADGHRMLFELFYKRVQLNPELSSIILGEPAPAGPRATN